MEIKLNKLEKWLSYIIPQKVGTYKKKDIFVESFNDHYELMYQDILLRDTSLYGNHIFDFVSVGIRIPKDYEGSFIHILKDIDFQFPIDKHVGESHIGPSRMNKMFHQAYYNITN